MDLNGSITDSANERDPALLKRYRRALSLVVASFVAVQLALALLVVPHFKEQIKPLYSIGHVDNYYSIAKSLENGDGYRFTPDTALTLMREPGYPYFLAELRSLSDDYQKLAIVCNVLFTAMCAWLIFLLARRLTTAPWVPVAAPILFMIHPGVLLGELRNGVEIPFTLLLLVFLLILHRALVSESLRHYAYAGLALGAASLVRSTALLFPTFLVFHEFLFRGGWRSLPRSVGKIAVVFAAALVVMSPWIVRNYMLVGKFIPTASVQGIAMHAGYYICTHEGTGRTFYQLDEDAADVRNDLAAQQGYRFQPFYYQYFYDPHDEVKFNASLSKLVVDEYRRSPGTFVKCASENVFNFWFRGKNLTATLANVCVQLPYMILAILGAIVGFRQLDKRTFALLALFLIYTMGVYVPIHAQARYSIPIVPLLSILAAIPLCRFFQRRPGAAAASVHAHA